MTGSEHYGLYEYKGFTIRNTGKKEWIAEPDWSIEAIEQFKYEYPIRHRTIAAAKKWINEIGIHFKEENFRP